MKIEQIFIGDIRKCTKYEEHTTFSIDDQFISESFGYIRIDDEIHKKDAILIKIENGGYVDLERFNSVFDYIKIYRDLTKNGYRLGGLMMSTSAHCIGSLFVDKESLKSYYPDKQQTNNISVRQLKKSNR